MNPARPLRARSRPICQLCSHILQQPTGRRSFLTTGLKTSSIRQHPARQNGAFKAIRQFASDATVEPRGAKSRATDVYNVEPEIERPEDTAQKQISLKKRLQQVEDAIQALINSPKVEPETETLRILEEIEYIAKRAIALRAGRPHSTKLNLRQSSASAILSLDTDDILPRKKASPKPRSNSVSTKSAASQEDELKGTSPSYLSQLATDLLKNEKIFIAPSVLGKYVDLHRLLGRPHVLPEIFHLYAHKPIPLLGSSPPTFSTPNPKSFKSAIPQKIAEDGLSAAIAAKDMPLALNIIDNTYCAPAWRSYKILHKVGPLASVVTLTPFALYALATELSNYSGYIDPWLFKVYCFAGLMTYVTCTGTLGYVAMTTYNDHHVRVVWQPGTGLMIRWLREDERAALDRIAIAWGFKEPWKRGDEEGEDWEGLREWCWIRRMHLDKPELMPGMNPSGDGE